jgi:hypothetical protein
VKRLICPMRYCEKVDVSNERFENKKKKNPMEHYEKK